MEGFDSKRQEMASDATLRDYFAAKAMSGWLASYPESCTHPIVAGNADEVAKHSYMLADAMLKARG